MRTPCYRLLFGFPLVLTLLARAVAGGPGFTTEHLLHDQFEKHRRDFGPITEQQYLRLARHLRDARPGTNILEARRPDGAFFRFDRKRGYFGAYDPSGAIRTFFRPLEGARYFDREVAGYESR